MTQNHTASLHILGDRGRTVDRSADDVRGRQVRDTNGESIGKVADLLVDDQEKKVRFLLVEHGGFLGFGATKPWIPVDGVTKITEDDVFVDQSGERVAPAVPGYDPNLVDDRPYQASLHRHYRYAPYWQAGYKYPVGIAMLPISPSASRN